MKNVERYLAYSKYNKLLGVFFNIIIFKTLMFVAFNQERKRRMTLEKEGNGNILGANHFS